MDQVHLLPHIVEYLGLDPPVRIGVKARIPLVVHIVPLDSLQQTNVTQLDQVVELCACAYHALRFALLQVAPGGTGNFQNGSMMVR